MINTKTAVTLEQLIDAINNSKSITLIVNSGDFTLTQGDLTSDCLTYVPDKQWLVVIVDALDLSLPIFGDICLVETKDIDDSSLHLYSLTYQGLTITIAIR